MITNKLIPKLFITAGIVVALFALIRVVNGDQSYFGELLLALAMVGGCLEINRLQQNISSTKDKGKFTFSYMKKTPNGQIQGHRECYWWLLDSTLSRVEQERDGNVEIKFLGSICPEHALHIEAIKSKVNLDSYQVKLA